MTLRPLLSILSFVMLATAVTLPSATAGEMDFVFVDRLPDVEGKEIRRLTNFDPERGISFRKAVYEDRLDGLVVVSISVELFCGRAIPDEPTEPTIVAFKHVPVVRPHLRRRPSTISSPTPMSAIPKAISEPIPAFTRPKWNG